MNATLTEHALLDSTPTEAFGEVAAQGTRALTVQLPALFGLLALSLQRVYRDSSRLYQKLLAFVLLYVIISRVGRSADIWSSIR